MASAFNRRRSHKFYFSLWSRSHHRLPRPWSHLITGLWSRFPLVILITIYVATASYKRRSHICYFPMWSRHHYRHSHGVTTLQIFIPVITPLTLDLFSAIFSKLCNQMYLIKIWNRVQLTCLLAGSLDAHQWTSRFAVKIKSVSSVSKAFISFNAYIRKNERFYVFCFCCELRDTGWKRKISRYNHNYLHS